MSIGQTSISSLRRKRPEWAPWLDVVEVIQRETTADEWDALVPGIDASRVTPLPVLANAAIELDERLLRVTWQRIARAVQSSGSETLPALWPMLDGRQDMLAWFVASLSQDSHRIAELAGNVSGERMQPLIALFSMPFLHACRRRYEPQLTGWIEPFCPICAAWPAFIEVRGIERARHARCNRCGSAWFAQLLKCPYCDTQAHSQLTTLVPQDNEARGSIEACQACGHYTKAFTALQGCAAAAVYVEDLASVDLDLAALDAGYARPQRIAQPLTVTAHVRRSPKTFFRWAT